MTGLGGQQQLPHANLAAPSTPALKWTGESSSAVTGSTTPFNSLYTPISLEALE